MSSSANSASKDSAQGCENDKNTGTIIVWFDCTTKLTCSKSWDEECVQTSLSTGAAQLSDGENIHCSLFGGRSKRLDN